MRFNEVVKKDLGFKAIANVLKQDMSIARCPFGKPA
jgi:hypothetical protein